MKRATAREFLQACLLGGAIGVVWGLIAALKHIFP